MELLHTRIESLFKVAEMIASENNIDDLLDGIIEHVQKVMHASAASLYVRIPGTDFLEVIGARGHVAEKLQRTKLKFGEGIGGTVAKTRQPINVADAYEDSRFSSAYDKQTGFRTKQMLSMPMIFANSIVGVITVINKVTDTPFDEEDVKVLSLFCSQTAIAIFNAQEKSRHERRIETTSLFSREITNVLGREITLIYGYLSHLQRKIAKVAGSDPMELEKVQKTFSSLESSAEQVRRLSLSLSSIAQCLEEEAPDRFSWADFLSFFQKESKYQTCHIMVVGQPKRSLYAPKLSVIFVIDSLLQIIEKCCKHQQEDFTHNIALVIRERSDMCDFCICYFSDTIPEHLKFELGETVKNGLNFVAILSAVEMIHGELLTTEALEFHNVSKLTIEDPIFMSKDSEKLYQNTAGWIVWQLSLPLATEHES